MGNNKPYISFGIEFKKLRKDASKSLSDLSGAVEYEIDYLRKIEDGEARPSEVFIILLINLFKLDDDQAEKLWQLAGYNNDAKLEKEVLLQSGSLPIIIPMPESRIIYTDTVNVTANNYGVVINFMQNSGSGNNMAISKVGMSLDHAVNFMKMMSDTIEKVIQHKGTGSIGDKSADLNTSRTRLTKYRRQISADQDSNSDVSNKKVDKPNDSSEDNK